MEDPSFHLTLLSSVFSSRSGFLFCFFKEQRMLAELKLHDYTPK